MIEYILIAGVNDTDTHAERLGKLMKPRNVMINLIPYNDTGEVINESFKAPTEAQVDAFRTRVIEHSGRIVRVRREMGADIAGACGQLVLSNKGSENGKQAATRDIEDLLGSTDTKKQNNKAGGGSAAQRGSVRRGGGVKQGGGRGGVAPAGERRVGVFRDAVARVRRGAAACYCVLNVVLVVCLHTFSQLLLFVQGHQSILRRVAGAKPCTQARPRFRLGAAQPHTINWASGFVVAQCVG